MKIDFTKEMEKAVPGWRGNPFLGLLQRFLSKQITEEEFNREIAYGAMESINQCRYEPEPMEPRQVLELNRVRSTPDWSRKRREDQDKIVNAVMNLDSIKKWREEVEKIRAKNGSALHWLKQYLEWLPAEDTVNQRRIIDVIRTHERAFSWVGKGAGVQDAKRDVPAVHEPSRGTASPVAQNPDEPKAVSNVSEEHLQRGIPVPAVPSEPKEPAEHKPGSRARIRTIPEGDIP